MMCNMIVEVWVGWGEEITAGHVEHGGRRGAATGDEESQTLQKHAPEQLFRKMEEM